MAAPGLRGGSRDASPAATWSCCGLDLVVSVVAAARRSLYG